MTEASQETIGTMARACQRLLLVPLVWLFAAPISSADVLVLEQEYNLVRSDKDGIEAKDIRQRVYLTKGMVRIDEFDGEGKEPTGTLLIDFARRTITDLDRRQKTRTVETFDQRCARIESRKQRVQGLIDDVEGIQKEKTAQLYRALLDDNRVFKLVQDEGQKKQVSGVDCTQVRVVDLNDPAYEPLTLYLNPKKELPYDSAEVLYLLQIIGGKLRNFLDQNKAQFKHVPMEMAVELAAGGSLKVKVVHVEEISTDRLDPSLFLIPDGYTDRPPPVRPDRNRKVDPTQ